MSRTSDQDRWTKAMDKLDLGRTITDVANRGCKSTPFGAMRPCAECKQSLYEFDYPRSSILCRKCATAAMHKEFSNGTGR